jgi:lysine-N-methylase
MTHHPLHSTAFITRFSCLGDTCEDTCCKSWSMQVDDATLSRYRDHAPDLLDAVVEGHDGGHIMRRDPKTDFCVKFEDGLCSIHRDRGSDFLGDACHFYPRVTRRLGNQAVMTGTMSCPEVTRLALFGDEASFALHEGAVDRLPDALKGYGLEGVDAAALRGIHEAFVAAALDETHDAAHNMARIVSVAQSLGAFGVESWAMAVPFYLKSASERLMAPEDAISDPFNLLHALMGLVAAAGASERPRLRDTIADMESALQVELDWQSMGIRTTGDSAQAFAAMQDAWRTRYAAHYERPLRRWIAAQLGVALFPFAGFGADMQERAFILGVRFATFRLALMSACHVAGGEVDESQTVRIAQSLSRVLDHLADPELSLKIYEEPGWLREGRLRALMGDG